jgi:hypothetical protein
VASGRRADRGTFPYVPVPTVVAAWRRSIVWWSWPTPPPEADCWCSRPASDDLTRNANGGLSVTRWRPKVRPSFVTRQKFSTPVRLLRAVAFTGCFVVVVRHLMLRRIV